jgi:hypothetical protein
MDCGLRVASEWILNCGDVVFEYLCSDEKLKESSVRSLRTGPLCLDTPVKSETRRWHFWMNRFLEIGSNRETLELDNSISGRIIDTVYSMVVTQERHEG